MGNEDFEIIEEECVIEQISDLEKYKYVSSNVVLYLNIRSLNANFDSLEILIEQMKNKPIAIICCETWNLECYNYFKIEKYKIYYNGSKINKNDGVVLYIREDVRDTTVIKKFGNLSILHSTLTISTKVNITISAIYRSHDIPKTEFILQLKNLLEVNKHCHNHWIIGDFNINLLELDCLSQDFLSLLLENGYKPLFKGITRPSVDLKTGTCIDNIFIKQDSLDLKSFKLISGITDHYPLLVSFTNSEFSENNSQEYQCIRYTKLKKLIGRVDWQNVILSDPNISMNLMIDEIKNCINLSTICISKLKHNSKKNT